MTSPNQNLRILTGVLLLLLALLVGGLLRELPVLQALSQARDTEQLGYPATDWVQWGEDKQGVYAADVLPPASSHPLLPNYVAVGERLLAVNFRPLAEAHMVRTLSRGAPPGTVFAYKLAHLSHDPPQRPDTRTLFVRTTYKPVLLFEGEGMLWRVNLVMMVVLGGVCLALLFLLAPFLRGGYQGLVPVAALLLLLLLFAANQALRHLILAIDTRFTYINYERVACTLAALLLVGIGHQTWVATARINIRQSLPSLLFAAFALGGVLLAVWGSQFAMYERWLLQLLFGGLLLHLGVAQWYVVLQEERQASAAARWWRWAGALLLTLAAGIHLLDVWQLADLNYLHRNRLYFGALLALVFPVANNTQAAIRFGNLNLVRNRSVGLSLGLAAVLIAYLLLDRLLEGLVGDAINRGLLEIAVIFILAILLRMIYLRYQPFLNRVLPLGTGRRGQRMQYFLDEIPRYTNSEKLLHDVAEEVRAYTVADFCVLHTADHSSRKLTPEEAQYLQQLQGHIPPNGFWSAAQELSAVRLPAELDAWLRAQGIRLVFSLGLTASRYGLMLIGAKPHGAVYNLGETEVLQRVAQQTRLSLELLYLLEREKALMQQTMEANLAALRSQINPHFLFNTLNTIADLIHHSPDLAEQAVEKLAFIFRYTLRVSGQNFVPLSEELALVRNYLDIEQIRFGERLAVDISVQPDAEPVPIPAFVLQTLVENCIKHGIAKRVADGRVSIAAHCTAAHLRCTVFDNGPGIDPARVQKGTGLRNVLARMRSLYNQDDLLSFDNTGEGTLVTLRIPLHYEHTESTGS